MPRNTHRTATSCKKTSFVQQDIGNSGARRADDYGSGYSGTATSPFSRNGFTHLCVMLNEYGTVHAYARMAELRRGQPGYGTCSFLRDAL
jgi:hypothetical protein